MSSDSIYQVENIADFDLAGSGAGSSKGTKRLSRQDLQRLHQVGGFSKSEILDYADEVTRTFDDNDEGWGGKAQDLLDDWRSKIPKEEKTEPAPEPQKPIEYSPELQQAHDRVNQWESGAWSGEQSQKVFGTNQNVADGAPSDLGKQQKEAAQNFAINFADGVKRDIAKQLTEGISV